MPILRCMGKRLAPQNEAIFQIIRTALGTKFVEGMNVGELLLPSQAGSRIESDQFKEIRKRVFEGLRSGSIPMKGKSGDNPSASLYLRTNSEFKLRHYANNILRYWLRRDPRLGGKSDRSGRRPRGLANQYSYLCSLDKQLRILEAARASSRQDELQTELLILKRKFTLLLVSIKVKPQDLPDNIQQELLFLEEIFFKKAS